MFRRRLIKIMITLVAITILSGCSKDKAKESSDSLISDVSVHSVSDNQLSLEMDKILNDDGYTGFINDIPLEERTDILEHDTVFFPYNSSEITTEMMNIITKHLNFLQKHKNIKIILEGHTDKRGSNAYNIVLGEKRAQSVKDVLLAHGIPDTQVEIISYGELKPLSIGGTEESWGRDRRAVFTYQ